VHVKDIFMVLYVHTMSIFLWVTNNVKNTEIPNRIVTKFMRCLQ
jgi:hypothetical protein